MAVYLTYLGAIAKVRFKPFETALVNTTFLKLPYNNIMIDSVESLFKIDKDNSVKKAIMDVNRPTISGFS